MSESDKHSFSINLSSVFDRVKAALDDTGIDFECVEDALRGLDDLTDESADGKGNQWQLCAATP